jgi:hypothetical protein
VAQLSLASNERARIWGYGTGDAGGIVSPAHSQRARTNGRSAGCPTFRALRNVGFHGPIPVGRSGWSSLELSLQRALDSTERDCMGRPPFKGESIRLFESFQSGNRIHSSQHKEQFKNVKGNVGIRLWPSEQYPYAIQCEKSCPGGKRP